MPAPNVVIVDYGVGNLLSVQRALEHCGVKAVITGDADLILAAAKVVLPGVGAFPAGMKQLAAQGLDRVVREVAGNGVPLLGICLGMQMLVDGSDEFGSSAGLGLIPGRVVAVPAIGSAGLAHKIPHIGWNELRPGTGGANWNTGLLRGVEPGQAVYFVHSFMVEPADSRHRIADCLYDGIRIAAVVAHANVMGCQFHPEKSGAVGLEILRNFLS